MWRRWGAEVAQEVLAETQSDIFPLAPYLDTLRLIFITGTLVAIAITTDARIDDWKRGRRSLPGTSLRLAGDRRMDAALRAGRACAGILLFPQRVGYDEASAKDRAR